jgi:multidrug transporter EmrE-like cation transporter
MQLTLSAIAAFCFALGGVFMKQADGVRHASAAFVFLFLFASGAVLQSEAMRGAGLALTYVLVLGLEAAIAVGFGVLLFGESMTLSKAGGVLMILCGIAVLRFQ